jgi:hypothetical protein
VKKLLLSILLYFFAGSALAGPVLLAVAIPESEIGQIVAEGEAFAGATYAARDALSLSMGEAFCGLGYLLDGNPYNPSTAAGKALMGGSALRLNGQFRSRTLLLSPSQVKESALALSSISPEDLRARFDADAINMVCAITKDFDPYDPFIVEDLIGRVEPLKQFYARAAVEGRAVLLLLWFGPLPLQDATRKVP